MIKRSLLLIAALTGCGSHPEWRRDFISTGTSAFDSVRLVHEDPFSPLRFEIIRFEGEVVAYLSLMRYKFSLLGTASVTFEIGGEKSERDLPVLEGRMRIRVPAELTKKVIHALQEGEEVVIMVDGFEALLKPSKDFFPYE
jgi:hypothetical protein